MATAIIDLELTALPPAVEGLDGYDKAFVLARYKGRPAAAATLPLYSGTLDLSLHYRLLADAAAPIVKERWLQEKLGVTEEQKPIPAATIAICTRNRPVDLQNCLQALQLLPDDGQEILVVDNSPSNDESLHVVEQFPRVRYVREDRPGLNIARNRALREASHELVLFTDDDAVPDPQWLRALARNFDHPLVACVTGLTLPLELETPAQEAFEHYSGFSRGFERKRFEGHSFSSFSSGHIGAGVNMALRKNIIGQAGPFDEALDAGTVTRSGGDHEYFMRILLKGYDIVYEPAALSRHRHRRTWQETQDTIRGYGTGVYAYWTKLLVADGQLGVIKMPIGWLWHDQLPDLLRALLRRPKAKPMKLLLAELRGCLAGPRAYYRARRNLKRISS